MARQRRSSGHTPEGSDPRDRWRDYDDAEIPEDSEWTDDDSDSDDDPFDGRPLPRRRHRRGGLARALAWTGVAALLMVTGGILALALWRTADVTVVSGAPEPGVAAPSGTAPPGEVATPGQGVADPTLQTGDEGRGDTAGATPTAAGPVDRSATPGGPDGAVSPPPLPPLPPGLEVGAPSAATRPEAAPSPESASRPEAAPQGATKAPTPTPAPVSPPAPARDVPPAPVPSRDTRTSEEIMADFLVSSGDRAQAETTARAYAEWYPAGSAERAYWVRVLGSVRARP